MPTRTLPYSGTLVVLALLGVLLYLVFSGDPAAPSSSGLPAQAGSASGNASLKIDILAEGSGEEAKEGDRVSVYYVGRLENGTVFDQNLSGAGFSFMLGAGEVIDGWDLGVSGMRPGEKRRLVVPPGLAYGAYGIPGVIPPNATLTFDVELVGVSPA